MVLNTLVCPGHHQAGIDLSLPDKNWELSVRAKLAFGGQVAAIGRDLRPGGQFCFIYAMRVSGSLPMTVSNLLARIPGMSAGQ